MKRIAIQGIEGSFHDIAAQQYFQGEQVQIMKINGNAEVKQHLADMGFVVGGTVTVVNTLGGNMIVNVKDSRVAIDKQMAQKIMV